MRTIRQIILLSIFIIFPIYCCAGTQDMPDTVQTVRDVEKWLSAEFTYQWELTDEWQTAGQTISLKKGDCEDFAILGQTILADFGIKGDIIIVLFQDLNISHALFVWQDKGNFRFVSNREVLDVEADSLEDAIGEMYSDWREIVFMTDDHKPGKRIRRKI